MIPSIVSTELNFVCNLANIVLAGQMDDTMSIAAVGLAITSMNTVFRQPIVGMNSPQDMLTSQAFGAGDHKLCG